MPEYELRTRRSLVHTNQTQNPFQSKNTWFKNIPN